MRSNLFGEHQEAETQERFAKQNSKMIKVRLDGEVMARQGAMVAFQGNMEFQYEGSGSIGKFLKKAITGEGVPLMKVSGRGDVFFASNADDVHLIALENESVTISGMNVLAFDSSLQWDIKRVEGVGFMAGGMFNTTLTGTGQVAITTHGTPVVLATAGAPTFVDIQSAVAWSTHLQTGLQKSFKLGSLVGRGSGEAFQLSFAGDGFVVVQASEGHTVPPHSHGNG